MDTSPPAALRFRSRFTLATGLPSAEAAICFRPSTAAPLAWLLLEACRHATRRQVPIAVPLARLPPAAALLPALDAALAKTGLLPASLTLELPSRCPAGSATLLALSAVRDRGVGLTLAGMPDLVRLHRLPLTGLLLPTRLPVTVFPAALLAARSLGLRTTANGIETELQRAWLHQLGCGEGEGPLFGPANPEQLDTCGSRHSAPASAHDLQPAGRARH